MADSEGQPQRSATNDFGLPLFLVDNLAVAFTALDSDQSGSLDRVELRRATDQLLSHLSEQQRQEITEAIMEGADSNRDGLVDFAEFLSFVERRKAELEKTVEAIRYQASVSRNAISEWLTANLTPQSLSSMFYSFAGTGQAATVSTSRDMDENETRRVVTDVFPDLPRMCVKEIVSKLHDVATHLEVPLTAASVANAIALPFELMRTQSKKRVPLGSRKSLRSGSSMGGSSSATIGELRREDSALVDPLAHLSAEEIDLLASHMIHGPQLKRNMTQLFRDVTVLSYAIRECFDASAVSDELVDDLVNLLCGMFAHGGNYGLGDLLRSLLAVAHKMNAAAAHNTLERALPYTITSVESESFRQVIDDTLSPEEVDLLRDAFIRLDGDGDGFVTQGDCCRVAEVVMEQRFATFLPYLSALFAIADKNADGKLSLAEFVMSFVEGPGVVPQEVITACVAPVKLRLTNDELALIQKAFYNMDTDDDQLLDFGEVLNAIHEAMQGQYPDISAEQYQYVVDVIFSKADRDFDGKLNLSEFILSLQEEQGVIPVQLLEHFGKTHPLRKEGDAASASNPAVGEQRVASAASGGDTVLCVHTSDPDSQPTTDFATAAAQHSSTPDRRESSSANAAAVALLASSTSTPPNHKVEEELEFLTEAEVSQVSSALIGIMSQPTVYLPEGEIRDQLETLLTSQAPQLAETSRTAVVETMLRHSHRNAAGEVSVVEAVRRFCLGQLKKKKRHSVEGHGAHVITASNVTMTSSSSPPHPAGAATTPADGGAAVVLRDVAVAQHHHHPDSDILRLTTTLADTLTNAAEAVATTATNSVSSVEGGMSGAAAAAPVVSSAEAVAAKALPFPDADAGGSNVYVPEAENTIFHRMFDRLDLDRDGYLVLDDMADLQRRLLHERHRDSWSPEDVERHIVQLFTAADTDGDGKLSFEEFCESFREGRGVLPADYVDALSEQILTDLSAVNLAAILGSLLELQRQHPDGFRSLAEISAAFERIVTPYVDGSNYAKIRLIVDYMVLHCPLVIPHDDGSVAAERSASQATAAASAVDAGGKEKDGGAGDANQPGAPSQGPLARTATLRRLIRFLAVDLLGLPDPTIAAAGSSTIDGANAIGSSDEETVPAATASPQTGTDNVTSAPGDLGEQADAAADPCIEATSVPGPASGDDVDDDKKEFAVAPYEFEAIRRVLLSIAQADVSLAAEVLHAKLLGAMRELFLEDSSLAERASRRLFHSAKTFVASGNAIDCETFATVCVGADVGAEVLGLTVPPYDERKSNAVEIINDVLPELRQRRILAEALLQVDVDRTGEIEFDALHSKLHDPLRGLSSGEYCRLVRALRFVGEKTVTGKFSITSFLKPFATVYYVEPVDPLPAGGLLRRLSTFEETLLLKTIQSGLENFQFADAGASHEVNIEELAHALGVALVSNMLSETLSIHDIRTVSRLFAELAVCGEHSLQEMRADTSKIRLPWTLLPSRLRCEYALRKLRVEVGEAAVLRKLCRVLLITDRHRNGVFSHTVLSEALTSELRLIHREWSAQAVSMSVEEWILAAEVDDKNYILFGKMIDTMLDVFPIVHPALVGEVFVAQELDQPEALHAALHHLAAKGEIPASQLKLFSSDGNGPVTAVLNFLCAVGWVEERGTVDFAAVYPACRFHPGGMVVHLNGLPQDLAQRGIFHVLPISRQRDLACAFIILDKRKEYVLDYDSLEAVLVQHERAQMKLHGAASTTGVRNGRLMEVELQERARRVFQSMDKMRLGLVTLEDFLASFARGLLQYSLIESILVVCSGGILQLSSSAAASAATKGSDPALDSGADGQSSPGQPRKPAAGTPSRITHPGLAISDQDLEAEFAKYDRRQLGFLSRQEFSEAYQKLEHFGLTPSKAEIDRLFSSICADKDKMTFPEFCIVMLRRSRM